MLDYIRLGLEWWWLFSCPAPRRAYRALDVESIKNVPSPSNRVEYVLTGRERPKAGGLSYTNPSTADSAAFESVTKNPTAF